MNIYLLDFSADHTEWKAILDLEEMHVTLITIDDMTEQFDSQKMDALVINFKDVEIEAPWIDRVLKARLKSTPFIPIIGLVSRKEQGDVERAIAAGCDLVITKPFTSLDFKKKAMLFEP